MSDIVVHLSNILHRVRVLSKDQSEQFAHAMMVLPCWNEKQTWACKSHSWSFPNNSENLHYQCEQPGSEKEQGEGECFLTCWRYSVLMTLVFSLPCKDKLLRNLSIQTFLGYLCPERFVTSGASKTIRRAFLVCLKRWLKCSFWVRLYTFPG